METVISFIFQTGLSIGVGSSTVALTLYLIALSDGKLEPSERHMLGGVYVILRIGMILIATGLALSFIFETVARDLQYAFQWAMLGALTTNAVLMTYHKISMQFAPALQGATWYALFFVTVLPVHTLPLVIVGVLYCAWVAVVYLIIRTVLHKIEALHGK